MGYANIPNLYADQTILMVKQVYALDKLDGTSCHVGYNPNSKEKPLHFFSGCINQDRFESVFNKDDILSKINTLEHRFSPTTDMLKVYGEGIGGKVQGKSKYYGNEVRFVAFEVQINDVWLNVPAAESVCKHLGIPFVHYSLASTDLDELNKLRDKKDELAFQLGNGELPIEGVILRPLIELTMNNGKRLMAKHKRVEERETKSIREVDPEKKIILENAAEIADEWVVSNRVKHVAESLRLPIEVQNIPHFIRGMIADIKKEDINGEITWTKEVERAIGGVTAVLIKKMAQSSLC